MHKAPELMGADRRQFHTQSQLWLGAAVGFLLLILMIASANADMVALTDNNLGRILPGSRPDRALRPGSLFLLVKDGSQWLADEPLTSGRA
ncbi:hypothetical protein KBK19_04790 [Microvirga sp. STR05]|uniref:Uncharacterized protein n=1 Tax=Hymenobacter duratus TaxID=2771356 RepID=A0ABR8JFK1_9BACT|nr:hypothetical protein [Hymenobacter duratus]MBD2714346.1 hypothetical protein [Hymenobacter duratus]MBR7949249.1 hypothetical protein [Microvirga sp. STR05]